MATKGPSRGNPRLRGAPVLYYTGILRDLGEPFGLREGWGLTDVEADADADVLDTMLRVRLRAMLRTAMLRAHRETLSPQ